MLIAHFLPPTFKRLPRRIASSPSCRLYAPEVSGWDKNFSPRGDMLDDGDGGGGGGDSGGFRRRRRLRQRVIICWWHISSRYFPGSRQLGMLKTETGERRNFPRRRRRRPRRCPRVTLQIGKKPPWRMAPSLLWQMAGQSLEFTASASADVAIISTVQFCLRAIWPDCRESRAVRDW